MDNEIGQLSGKDPLRDLFQESGHRSPAPGLEQKVLGRLQAYPEVSVAAPPLISQRAWFLAATLVLAAVIIGLLLLPTTPSHQGADLPWLQWSILPGLLEVLHSKWVLFTVAGALMLTLVDRMIGTKRHSLQLL